MYPGTIEFPISTSISTAAGTAVVSRSDVRVSFVRLRNVLLCSAVTTFCLFAGPAAAQQAITTPIFTSVGSDQNFRDLAGFAGSYGGTGFADMTGNGGAMRTGVFYRSEALSTGSLNATDRAILTSLNIGMVLDLRTDSERSVVTTPDPMAPNNGPDQSIGAREVWVNIYDLPSPPTPPTSDAADAKNFMITSYQNFVANPNEVQKFREALLELAHETGSSLYYCSGGKDRTGWTSMLLQTIAGVNPTTIMNGYLATNQYMATGIAHVLSGISDPNTNAAVAVLLGVQHDFLNAGLTQMSTTYGSMWTYLTASNGLALTLEDIYVLRANPDYALG
jgi:hypothetical protein